MGTRRVAHASFAALLAVPCGMALAYTDADVVALEISQQLLAPPELIAQVEADLAAIRFFDAYFENIHVFPDWIPGELLVVLSSSAWEAFLLGEYHGLDALNEQYGPVDVEVASAWLHELKLTFASPYNPVLLAPIYENADGVLLAEPNFYIGDGDDIFSSAAGTYTFKHGWGDCPAGCIAEHFWQLSVTDGVVQLVSEWGSPFGACCLPSHACLRLIRWECTDDWGGTFVGGGCAPSPCGATASPETGERLGWGRVKAFHRD